MDKKLAIIQNLLAKAASTKFPEEARTFQEKAEELMVKYGIEQAHLDYAAGKRGEVRESIGRKYFEFTGIYSTALCFGLMEALRALQTVETFYSTAGKSSTTMFIIGTDSDTARCVDMLQSLTVQAKFALATWWKTDEHAKTMKTFGSGMEQFKAKREFMRQFGVGVAARINEKRQAAMSESAGSELVLVDRLARATSWMNEEHPNVRVVKERIHRGTAGAAQAGKTAGKNASYDNSNRIGGSSTQIAGS